MARLCQRCKILLQTYANVCKCRKGSEWKTLSMAHLLECVHEYDPVRTEAGVACSSKCGCWNGVPLRVARLRAADAHLQWLRDMIACGGVRRRLRAAAIGCHDLDM